MKILLVPSLFITDYKSREIYRKKNFLKNILKLNFQTALYSLNEHLLSAEILFYAKLGQIIGKENVFTLGNLYEEYTSKHIPLDTHYPSIHNKEIILPLNFTDAKNSIKNFDYIIVGINSGHFGDKIRNLGIKYQIPVVVIDYYDHIFDHNSYNDKILFKELEYKKDFNLFFKHDLPKNRQDETIKPLAPMPCEPSNYNIPLSFNKTLDIFFRGRKTPSAKKDRIKLLEFLKNNFTNILIEIFERDITFEYSHRNYCEKLSQSILAFSPSGKTWDSTRHTETGLFNCIPLMPKPNIDIIGKISDMNNCLLYDPSKLSKNDLEELNEKIKYVLNDNYVQKNIRKNWADTVLKKHTLKST